MKVANKKATKTKSPFVHVIENTWLPGMDHGWGNGYVLIPKRHPLFKMSYDDIHSKHPDIDVHGGLTFADFIDEEVIKRMGFPAQSNGMWAIGFDTAHYQDDQYNWPKSRVMEESEHLLQQVLAITA